jgi:hypothetical protein
VISGIVTDRHATITLTFLLFNGSTIPIELVIQFTEGGLVTIDDL